MVGKIVADADRSLRRPHRTRVGTYGRTLSLSSLEVAEALTVFSKADVCCSVVYGFFGH